MTTLLQMLPKKGRPTGLTLVTDPNFLRSTRAAFLKDRGCQAAIDFGQCGRRADLLLVEGDDVEPELVPGWAIHGTCAACARLLGLVPQDAT